MYYIPKLGDDFYQCTKSHKNQWPGIRALPLSGKQRGMFWHELQNAFMLSVELFKIHYTLTKGLAG